MSKKINTKSMFEAIKQSLNAKKDDSGGNGLYKEVLKFKPGNTYQVRLVPNPNTPKESIFHYYQHIWNSNATGELVTALCPTTFGEKCPIDAYYLKNYKDGTEAEKKAAAVLSRKEGWLVNVYVISDPTNPENEGTVKILRYGRELARIIQSALEGDDAEDIGVEKAFGLDEGCTLRIKCEHKSDKRGGQKYVTYSASKFLPASRLDLVEAKLDAIFEGVHDLKSLYKQNTPAEMQRLLDEHFFNLSTGSSAPDDDDEDQDDSPEDENDSVSNDTPPWEEKKATPVKSEVKKSAPAVSTDNEDDTDASTDEKLKKLLAEL